MDWSQINSKTCSVGRSLAIFGDRWTLMIIRDAFMGSSRFSQFERSLGIPKHRLSDRLNRLVEADILMKVAPKKESTRHVYRLTEKGLDLMPVLLAISLWGDKHASDEDGPPLRHFHRDCGSEITANAICHECGEPITPNSYQVKLGPGIERKLARGEHIPEAEYFAGERWQDKK